MGAAPPPFGGNVMTIRDFVERIRAALARRKLARERRRTPPRTELEGDIARLASHRRRLEARQRRLGRRLAGMRGREHTNTYVGLDRERVECARLVARLHASEARCRRILQSAERVGLVDTRSPSAS